MELNVCKLAAAALHALVIGTCHSMCAQKIYKPSSRCQQNICQGLVLGARVVIFTATVTLEHPGLPSELDMGQCGLLGYDLTLNFMTRGSRIAKYLPALNQTLTSHSSKAVVQSSKKLQFLF